MRILISIILITLLSSCSATNYYGQTVQSWQGGNADTLVNSWGKPAQVTTATNGNTTYAYTTESYRPFPDQNNDHLMVITNKQGTTVGANMREPDYRSTLVQCKTVFEVNKAGKIVSTQYSGEGCLERLNPNPN